MSSVSSTAHSRIATVLLLTTVAAGCGRQPQSGWVRQPAALALTNATLVDVRSGELRLHQTLVIEAGRITAIGDRSRIAIPAGTRAVDVTGKYLVPGLMDTHVHFLSEWTNPPVDTAAYLGWILAGGVTSVREMSPSRFARSLVWRAAASEGRLLAPRVYISAGPDPALPNPWSALYQALSTQDPAEAIRRFRTLGIDGLKLQNFRRDTMLALIRLAGAAAVPVYGHTVHSSSDRPPRYENFTFDLLRAGLNGVVHSKGTVSPSGVDDPSGSAPAGTTLEEQRARWFHNRTAWKRVNEAESAALIDTMVARHAWYEPTRLVDYYWFHQDLYDTSSLSPHHPWRTRARSRMMADTAIRTAVLEAEAAEARFIKRFYQAGGLVLAGTDEVPFPPFGVTEEMRLLVEAGLPPLAALQAATINAARAMNWEDRVGSLEVGKLADILVLDANPLEDIANVRRIHALVADGRFLDRTWLAAALARVGTPIPRGRQAGQ